MCCAVQGVADGSLSVGDAVLFVTLMQQLYVSAARQQHLLPRFLVYI